MTSNFTFQVLILSRSQLNLSAVIRIWRRRIMTASGPRGFRDNDLALVLIWWLETWCVVIFIGCIHFLQKTIQTALYFSCPAMTFCDMQTLILGLFSLHISVVYTDTRFL